MSRSAIALGLTVLAGLTTSPASAAPNDLVLVSRGIDGLPASSSFGPAESNGAALSADGQRVAFNSSAPNIAPGVTNRQTQVYVRDLRGGGTILASRADGAGGAPSDNGGALAGLDASLSAITPDGRYVFFNAVLSDGGYYGYRRDLQLDRTELVTRADGPNGTPIQSWWIAGAASNGRYVVFYATGLVDPRAGPLSRGLYLRDLESGTTVLVSRGTGKDGAPVTDDDLSATGFSAGGRYIAFQSSSQELTSGPAGTGGRQIYLRDVRYGTTVLVSRKDGADGPPVLNRYVGWSPVRADGCVVAFDALGTDVAPGSPANGGVQSYVRDLCESTTRLVSRVDGPSGPAAATLPFAEWGNADVSTQGMSADGRYVVFTANTNNLTSGVLARVPETYVRDTVAGRTILVSRAGGPDGAPDADNTGHFGNAAMTPDAQFVAFSSKATNLVAGNAAGFGEVYRRELGPQPAGTKVVACGPVDDPGIGGSPAPACPAGGNGDGAGDPSPALPAARPIPVATKAPAGSSPGAGVSGEVPLATEPTLVRAPTLRTVRVNRSRVTLWVDLPATIEIRIARAAVHGKRRTWRAAAPIDMVLAKGGAARVALPRLARARYRLTIRALGIAGSRSPAVTRALDLRKKAAR
jgi:Tol biopolymer transport system component